MPKQNTVKGPAIVKGIALHTGARAALRILPAPPDTGIIFRRVDMPGAPEVTANARNVVDVRRATTIASRTTGAFVVTVEHIMSSLHAACVDNAVIEMDGPEPPIADGSAMPYFEGIMEAGIAEQDAEAQYWTASAPIVIEEGSAMLALAPADDLRISFTTEYGYSGLDTQFFSCQITPESFRENLEGARTFCPYKELEQVIAAGLAKGGSLDNAIILHDGALICKDGLRYPNELVRHKIMDMVGDLYLVGKRVRAHVMSVKSGHPTHCKLAMAMLEQEAKAAAAQ